MENNSRQNFQKQLSRLKKSGIVPKNLDIRKVKQTRHYNDLIKKNAAVAAGEERLFKVSNSKTLQAAIENNIPLREVQTRRGNSKYYVSVAQSERRGTSVSNLRVNRKGEITAIRTYKTKTGNKLQRKIKILNDYSWEGLEQKLRSQATDGPFTIKIFTGETGVYNNIEDAIKALRGYSAIKKMQRELTDPRTIEEIFNSIEVESK